jgi:Na+-transporting NADH:ubiquinone oxidoreductase subunit A
VISLAGPSVGKPRVLRTRVGASIADLTRGEFTTVRVRVISGSVLSGREARENYAYLGRHHLQISVIGQKRERQLFGWLTPGFDHFSVTPVFATGLLRLAKKFNFTASSEGSRRAMVPIGSYEKVMPLDVLPTFLLRALIVGDVEQAQALGCLELDEEDLALCGFVCPGKYDYGPLLREVLTRIEKEG